MQPDTSQMTSEAPPSDASTLRRTLSLTPKIRVGEWVIERGIQSIALICFALIALIFIFVFKEAAPLVFSEVMTVEEMEIAEEFESYGQDEDDAGILESEELMATGGEPLNLAHLSGAEWHPVSLNPRFGLLPLIVGSLKVTLIALMIALPMGIFAALYTSSFAAKWAKELMKPVIEILAGIPSVVIGFFALVILATLLQNIFGYDFRLNAFVGGVAMAIAVVPIIFTVSEDALAAIPKSMTEASLALGATKWETALKVILPAATPGIFAAVILGFGRAFGETMIVLMATGNAALLSPEVFESVRTLSATIGAEMAEVVFGDPHYRALFFIGSLLFVISFTLNAFAEFFVRSILLKKFRGGIA
jgi:phosphate transport system permease protein